MSANKPTKREAAARKAEWRARLATGRVVENIIDGHRTLIGFPTVEAAQAYVAEHPQQVGCDSITRIYTACMAPAS